MGSELYYSWLLKCVNWPSISTDPKIHYLLKHPSGLHVCFLWDTADPEFPQLTLEGGRTKKHAWWGIPAPKGSLVRMKREKGRQRPLRLLIFVPLLSLFTWIFVAWSHAHPFSMAIITKAHSKHKTLDKILLCKIGTDQWVYHFYEHSDPNDPSSFPTPNRPIWPWVQMIPLIECPPWLQGGITIFYWDFRKHPKVTRGHWHGC